MSNSISKFQLLTGIRLFTPVHKTTLPYDHKTNHRILSDIEEIPRAEYTFNIHRLYPQCYMLVWPIGSLKEVYSPVFSEVFYIQDSNICDPIVCCEKCNRLIDLSQFKMGTHDFLRIAGEQMILMSNTEINTLRYEYTARTLSDSYGCNSLCKTALLEEGHLSSCSHPVDDHILDIVNALGNGNQTLADSIYSHLLDHLKRNAFDRTPTDIMQGRFTHVMTYMVFELINQFPDYRQLLIHALQQSISEFLRKKSFSNQMLFAQDFLTTLIRLTAPVNHQHASECTLKVLSRIHTEYAQRITLKDMASNLSLQESHVSRQFKKDMSVSFSRYLMTYRLNRAILLMRETSLQLTDIAMLVGFDSSSYFSTCFGGQFGCSPSDYRKKCVK